MSSPRHSLLLFLFAISALAPTAQAQTEPVVPTAPPLTAPTDEFGSWKGPLALQNERPFQAIFLHLPPQNPDVLARGRQGWGVQLDIANNLLIPTPGRGIVEEDFETQRLKVEWRRGLGRGLEVSLGSNLTARNGGILDGPIDFYHDLLGLPGDAEDNPQGRDSRDDGRNVLFFQDAKGRVFNRRDDVFGLGDTTLTLKKQLGTGRLAGAGRFALKLPTGSGGKVLGSGGADAGVVLDARYVLARRVAVFGNVGAFKYGSADVPDAKSGGVQGGVGVEWKLGRRESLVAQIDAQSRTITTGNSFADEAPVITSLGYKRQVSRNRLFWVSFSENGDYHNFNAPLLSNIGPDFTLSLGYSWEH